MTKGYQSLYNLAFTSFPVIIFAVLDRDVGMRPEATSVCGLKLLVYADLSY